MREEAFVENMNPYVSSISSKQRRPLRPHCLVFGKTLNLNYVILLKICFCLRQLAYKTSKGVSLASKDFL